MNEELKQEQYELEGQSALLPEADEHFSIAISTIISMAQNACQIFKSSRVEAKRGSTSKIGAKSSCLRIISCYNHSSIKNHFRENYSMLKDDIITKNANI
ncbi:MAG: hypothetical protein IJ532_02595, partial [Alphaproteobacteria bacterium]|nr:hypothetical protein [Alphaproteobacteria bacterium]